MPCSNVETERLVLRRPTHDDLDEVYRIHSNPEVWEFSPESTHTAPSQSEEFLRTWLDDWERDGIGYWAVEHEGGVIGFGGLKLVRGWRGLRDVLNVYYRFDPSAWGRGFATEMVAAALDCAPENLPFVVRVRPANERSARVAERLGFERRPELDDELAVYVLRWD